MLSDGHVFFFLSVRLFDFLFVRLIVIYCLWLFVFLSLSLFVFCFAPMGSLCLFFLSIVKHCLFINLNPTRYPETKPFYLHWERRGFSPESWEHELSSQERYPHSSHVCIWLFQKVCLQNFIQLVKLGFEQKACFFWPKGIVSLTFLNNVA